MKPEIGHRDISFWWIWQNSSLEMALFWASINREYPPLSAEDRRRGLELADYFDGLVEVESDDK